MTNDTFNKLLSVNFHTYVRITLILSDGYFFDCRGLPCPKCPIYNKEDSLCSDHSDYLSNYQVEILKTQCIEAFI